MAMNEAIPEWLPCWACRYPLSAHFDLKCPFEASHFSPSDTKIILSALYEMRRMEAARSPEARKQLAKSSTWGRETDYRLAVDIVLDRWLKENGIP